MKAKQPHWTLDEVKKLATEGKMLLSKTKAESFFPNPAVAMAKAKTVIAELAVSQFAESLHQTDICDVYGVKFDDKGWYLKLTIDGLLVVVSLHPLERPLKTNSGLVQPENSKTNAASGPAGRRR